jgi:hypothetical protein
MSRTVLFDIDNALLNADGAINGGDTGKFAMYFNRKCV